MPYIQIDSESVHVRALDLYGFLRKVGTWSGEYSLKEIAYCANLAWCTLAKRKMFQEGSKNHFYAERYKQIRADTGRSRGMTMQSDCETSWPI